MISIDHEPAPQLVNIHFIPRGLAWVMVRNERSIQFNQTIPRAVLPSRDTPVKMPLDADHYWLRTGINSVDFQFLQKMIKPITGTAFIQNP
jgi:hypothetical protein